MSKTFCFVNTCSQGQIQRSGQIPTFCRPKNYLWKTNKRGNEKYYSMDSLENEK